MDTMIKRYMSFLTENKTERECVRTAIRMAEEKGYRNIEDVKELKAGDRVYVNVYGKSIILFQIGTDPIENGMNILGAHVDSPRLDLKMKPVYEKGGIVYLNTHYYGGIKKYQWMTHPLAIHGVVCRKDGTTVQVKLGEYEEDYTFCISDILPHIAQEQMRKTAAEFIPGENLDLVTGLNTTEDKEAGKNAVLDILREKYGIEESDLLSAELEVVPAGKARYLGLRKDMIHAYGQDDRVCAFTSLVALLNQENTPKRTSCCILADKEEIGSTGATGMDSMVLENAVAEVIDRLGNYSDLRVRRALRNSYMLSSDVNSAYDPLNSDLYDEANSSKLGKGIVFNKYTGSRGKSGASDANPEFIAKLRALLDRDGTQYQMAEMAKVDVGGGGTIAKYCAWYGMQVIDAGVSVLSMHAPREITSVFDVETAEHAYELFLTLA